MFKWRVTLSNGTVVEIEAYSAKDAILLAESKFGGVRALSAEWIQE